MPACEPETFPGPYSQRQVARQRTVFLPAVPRPRARIFQDSPGPRKASQASFWLPFNRGRLSFPLARWYFLPDHECKGDPVRTELSRVRPSSTPVNSIPTELRPADRTGWACFGSVEQSRDALQGQFPPSRYQAPTRLLFVLSLVFSSATTAGAPSISPSRS